MGALGEEEKIGVRVIENEDKGEKETPGILDLAEEDGVKVRPFEAEIDAVVTEFEEDTEGLKTRVKEPATVLVTLADNDTDGE